MFKFSITDRRLNPGGKSLTNRHRFLDRVKQSVREAANRNIKSRNIQDQSESEVTISRDGIDEPQFHYDSKQRRMGHRIAGQSRLHRRRHHPQAVRQRRGWSSWQSVMATARMISASHISYEEFVNAILEDLSLPDMVKASEKQIISFSMRRAGYTTVGAASNLALEKTMIQGIARRISLKTPKLVRIQALQDELLLAEDEYEQAAIEEEIASLQRRAKAINFLEKADLRYNNFAKQYNPKTQAVMFLCMDVSGSMGEREKTIAKKAFTLFCFTCSFTVSTRTLMSCSSAIIIRRKNVIRRPFSPNWRPAVLVVSTAYDEMLRIIRERYDVANWNIYLAQASDGDNTESDNHWYSQTWHHAAVVAVRDLHRDRQHAIRRVIRQFVVAYD